MKRPTHVLAKVFNVGEENFVYKVLNLKNSLACKWLLKHNITHIIVPDTKELEDVLPPFWGELRRKIFHIFFDMVCEFTPDLESLCSRAVVFHELPITIEYLPIEELDEDMYFLNTIELKELLQLFKYLKPDATEEIIRFRDKIKYHFQWRRTLSSKEVCTFDNNRDNEDDEL
jgi:hypothetical protein